MAKPELSISKRLTALQESLEESAVTTTAARDRQILEALALIAEGVSKTARDVTELKKQLATGK